MKSTGIFDIQSNLHEMIPPLDLRSCLVSVRGETIYEHYRNPEIPGQIAKINSCTKSILSSLICIAMDHGWLSGPQTEISAFFPTLLDDPDPRKARITLEHLLTMTAGFDWDEFGGQNSFPRMTRTERWVDFALEQRLSHAPGTYMEYNSGVSQMLSAILMQATNMPVARFAERFLFGPLDIETVEWESDPQGVHTGGFGLKMRPGDLLKFGQLFLQQGMWNGEQIISTELVHRSTQPFIDVTPPNRGRYGWHWWVDAHPGEAKAAAEQLSGTKHSTGAEAADAASLDYYYARGFGGQYVYVVPALELVTVLTNDKRKRDKPPLDVFPRLIAPMLYGASNI
ncbi:serine hydrolase [Paenibacillus sp. FSL W8-0426]|uniref:serine hydrolase domain-containing protein n=1 Tax=Paenibacillus sp. FSL W8-0426 TaxID=2921714 RepID=UPI0030DD821D